jgi:precorrin-6B methylase 2
LENYQNHVEGTEDMKAEKVRRMLLDLPYQLTQMQVVDSALDIAEIKSNEIFADLGCGDGTVLIRAAERFGVLSIGFELDLKRINIARQNVKSFGLEELIEIIHSDLFIVDISRFDVIYIYPSPQVVIGLSEKIIHEASKGSRIIIHDYPLEHIKPNKIIKISGRFFHTHKVYLYKMK